MGDVLVYMDPAVNDRLLAFARPLADAAGGALVALVASAEPIGSDALAEADVVLEVSHPALSPYLPEAHQAVLAEAIRARTPDLVLLENTTAGLRPRRGGGRDGGPPLRRLLRGPVARGRRGAGDQRDLWRAVARDDYHRAARGLRDQHGRLREEPHAPAGRARRARRRPPSSTT